MTDLRQAAEAFLNDWEDHSHPNIYGDFDDELLRSAEALRAALIARAPALDAAMRDAVEALDYYGCIDHYQAYKAVAPIEVQADGGKRARAALARARAVLEPKEKNNAE